MESYDEVNKIEHGDLNGTLRLTRSRMPSEQEASSWNRSGSSTGSQGRNNLRDWRVSWHGHWE